MVSRAEDTNTNASAIGERSGERAGYTLGNKLKPW